MLNPAQIANQIRRIAQAIHDGKIEARLVAEMTDEQIDEFNAKLASEVDDAVAEGEELSQEGPR